MKVSELIEKLKEMPQDMEVQLHVYGEEKKTENVIKTFAYGFGDYVVEIS